MSAARFLALVPEYPPCCGQPFMAFWRVGRSVVGDCCECGATFRLSRDDAALVRTTLKERRS